MLMTCDHFGIYMAFYRRYIIIDILRLIFYLGFQFIILIINIEIFILWCLHKIELESFRHILKLEKINHSEQININKYIKDLKHTLTIYCYDNILTPSNLYLYMIWEMRKKKKKNREKTKVIRIVALLSLLFIYPLSKSHNKFSDFNKKKLSMDKILLSYPFHFVATLLG